MALPAGARYEVRPTVQAAQVPWTGAQEWALNLLCICDMEEGINTGAQSFVAGLAADLSDLEITNAGEIAIPWRRAEPTLFSQAAGAEKLWVRVRAALDGDTNTEYRAFRGCTAPTGENSGGGVVGAGTILHLGMYSVGNSIPDTAEVNDGTRANYVDSAGKVGVAQRKSAGGNTVDVASHASLFPGTAITFTLWMVHPNTIGLYEYLFNRKITWKGAGYSSWMQESKIVCFRGGGAAATEWTPAPAVDDGGWHHLVLSIDGTSGTLFVNGVSLGTKTVGAPTYVDTTLNVGSERGGWTLADTVEGFRVESTAWSVIEALADFNMTSAPATWCVCGAEERASRRVFGMLTPGNTRRGMGTSGNTRAGMLTPGNTRRGMVI